MIDQNQVILAQANNTRHELDRCHEELRITK